MKRQEKYVKLMEKLARSRINDAVRLAFWKDGDWEDLDKLDLSAVTEIKRGSNGVMELKFIDRMAALKWLAERETGRPGAEVFFGALEENAQRMQEER